MENQIEVGNISIAEIRDNAKMVMSLMPKESSNDEEAVLIKRLWTLLEFIGSEDNDAEGIAIGQSMAQLGRYESDILLYSFFIAKEHPAARELLFRRNDPVYKDKTIVQIKIVQTPAAKPNVNIDSIVLIKNLNTSREFFIEFTDDPEKRKLKQDENEFVVYDDSTIGKKIMGQEEGFQYELNKISYLILEVFRKGVDRSAQ